MKKLLLLLLCVPLIGFAQEKKEITKKEITEINKKYIFKNNKGNKKEPNDGNAVIGSVFGDGLNRSGENRKVVNIRLDCAQGKGTGHISVESIIDADGNVVDINTESFECTVLGLNFASKKQIEKLFDCIKEKYKVTPSIGEDRSNKLHLIKIDFIHD